MFVEFTAQYKGFEVAVMVNDLGYRCGYVGVPDGHPLYGVRYEDAEDMGIADVHGGLTYSGHRFEEYGPWYFGFDCAHWGDAPDPAHAYGMYGHLAEGHVWTLVEVLKECFKLADGILSRYQ